MGIDIVAETRYRLLHDEEVEKKIIELGQEDLFQGFKPFKRLPEELQSLMLEKEKKYPIPFQECIRCYQCVDVCPILKKKGSEK